MNPSSTSLLLFLLALALDGGKFNFVYFKGKPFFIKCSLYFSDRPPVPGGPWQHFPEEEPPGGRLPRAREIRLPEDVRRGDGGPDQEEVRKAGGGGEPRQNTVQYSTNDLLLFFQKNKLCEK